LEADEQEMSNGAWQRVGNIMGPPGASGGAGANFVYGEDLTHQIDGASKLFTVSASFIANSLEVYLNGLRQRRVDDYTEVGTTQFQMVTAPRIADTISVDYSQPPPVRAVFGETPAGAINGTNKTFITATPYLPLQLAVFLDGLRLRRADDYIESDSRTFQLIYPPQAGDSLTIDYMQP
jgi:hypothetical protein